MEYEVCLECEKGRLWSRKAEEIGSGLMRQDHILEDSES